MRKPLLSSINLRSLASSLANNKSTLFERDSQERIHISYFDISPRKTPNPKRETVLCAIDRSWRSAFSRSKVLRSIERDWHYVTSDEYEKLMACSPLKLKLLIALCRLAALRRGEALNLEWSDVDWENNRIRIIADEEWQPKDKDKRMVPICPELQALLLEAYNAAETGSEKVVSGVNVNNLWRDFQVLFRRSDVKKYSKPFHTLRKSCITHWAVSYPAHVVKEWADHSSLETTDRYYLQVPESEYNRAATNKFWPETTRASYMYAAQRKAIVK